MKRPHLLYRLIDQNQNPFYIGITSDSNRRLKEHKKDFVSKKCSKFKGVTDFSLEILMINTNKKFNIKLLETYIIIWDKLFGDKLLKNQYIY